MDCTNPSITKRTSPGLSRVGGTCDTQWHRTHFRDPLARIAGSIMPQNTIDCAYPSITKRTNLDLSRLGGKYDTQWHRTHFRNLNDLVTGSIMPPFPYEK